MKGKVVALLFALPFFCVGAWMGYSMGSAFADAWEMRQWEPVQAKLSRAGYERHDGDESDTYEAYAVYHYEFGGLNYTGQRVAISAGADNIGNFQTNLGSRLSGIMSRSETVTVYVDPDQPASAIVDRSVRWGLIGFKSIFFLVFGGFGLALIIFTLRAPTDKEASATEYVANPWLINEKWQTAEIRSSSKSTMIFCWGFAAVWNLISAPLPFVIYSEVTEKSNLPALIGLLFPLIGIGLLIWAVRRTLEWTRFGPAPVTLDPFPGSIGGHVGGTIDVRVPFDSGNQFSLTLTNLHSYVSGSGKNRSRREDAKWQDKQVAHISSSASGSRLRFRFEVPEDLAESSADQSDDSYDIWRLNVKASLPGTDLDRDYEIPVYATAQESASLSDISIEEAKSAQRIIDNAAIEKEFETKIDCGGKTMFYPMGRNLVSGIGGVIFGAIFSGAGWFLFTHENAMFMGSIFAFVGVVILISALYFVLNSLEVAKQGGEIRTIRRVLGIVVSRRKMLAADFVRFTKQATSKTQSGSKHVVRYSISAVNRHNERMVVGEGFAGASQAKAAMEFVAKEFGLVVSDKRLSDRPSEVDQYNFLTAD